LLFTRLQVLHRSDIDVDPALSDIYSSTEAVLFLGTPHRGSNKAEMGEIARKIASVSGFDTAGQNIRALQVNSNELELIHEAFMRLLNRNDSKLKPFTFQEAKGFAGTSHLKLNERVSGILLY
jgi:hypothetical protein